jgi:PKD repeat protein
LGLLAAAPAVAEAAPVPIRGAYFYSYMDASHMDSLAAVGFNRAVVKVIYDSLGARGATEIGRLLDRGTRVGVDVVPEWSLQARSRLDSLPTRRRYEWGSGVVELNVGCPIDSLFWSSTFRDRAVEILSAFPSATRLAVDLEIYTGTLHHYDAGPCRCASCLSEFAAAGGTDLESFEEDRLVALLTSWLRELAASRPGLEIGFFDLDFASFVHRATIRALVASGVPTTNYCERSYSSGGSALPEARATLAARGLVAPLVGGLWLKNFTPVAIGPAIDGVLNAAEGYFVFTSYSLWQDPARLAGAYVIPGSAPDYWTAFGAKNRAPVDGVAPKFLAGPAATTGTGSIRVSWMINETAAGTLRYGTTTAMGESVATAPATTHVVNLAGLARNQRYYLQAVVRDSVGNASSSGLVGVTTPANGVPVVATVTATPASGNAPLTAAFAASASDPDGDPLAYAWSFGDGGVASGASVSHVYAWAGAYTATLTVTDGFGGSAVRTVTVNAIVAFPATPVLDNFNRVDAALMSPWTGSLSVVAVRSSALAQISSGTASPIWNRALLGPNQEVHVTLAAITSSASDHDLLLKCQGIAVGSGAIQVRYDAHAKKIMVSTLTPGSGWKTWGTISQTLVAGDRFGARAYADGNVEVYRNGSKLTTVSVSRWSGAALGGRIGIMLVNATTARLDNFGGGGIVPAAAGALVATAPEDRPASIEPARPASLGLSMPYPNPSDRGIRLDLTLPRAARVSWSIHDPAGRRVWRESREFPGGRATIDWSGRSEAARDLEPGLYFVRVVAEEKWWVRRFSVIR